MTKETRAIRAAFFASLLFLVIPVAVAAYRRREPSGLVLAVLLSVALLGWHMVPALERRGYSVKWFVSLAVLNVVLVIPEVALRCAGFRRETGVEFGWPRPRDFQALVPDEKLFWRLKPGATNFMDVYDGLPVNSLGFTGPEITTPKAPQTYRILYLGDSCTQQGFPFGVQAMLNYVHRASDTRFEAIDLGVAGYTSHQGLLLAEMYGATLEPDLAVVFFGWNDLRAAYGEIDAHKGKGLASATAGASALVRQLRVVQGIDALLGRGGRPLMEQRVPPDEYRKNLLAIKRLFDLRNVPVIFMTAPTSMYLLGVPRFLLGEHFVRRESDLVRDHKKYNEIVREVCKESGALLIDLETEFNALADGVGPLFRNDAIHFSTLGLMVVSNIVTRFIDRTVLAHEGG
jgi:lysophospholipase L1-like esterase